jgi:hypothetical protein
VGRALKDDGREGEGCVFVERCVRAKDGLFVLDCFLATLLAMTLAEGRFLRGEHAMTLAEGRFLRGEHAMTLGERAFFKGENVPVEGV